MIQLRFISKKKISSPIFLLQVLRRIFEVTLQRVMIIIIFLLHTRFRLKRAKDFKTDELCIEEAPKLQKKLDEIMRHGTMPRKLGPTVKGKTGLISIKYLLFIVCKVTIIYHILFFYTELNKDVANYLSTRVTKPRK